MRALPRPLVVLMALLLALRPAVAGGEVYYDFRDRPVPDDLTVIGDTEGQCVKPEAKGLRITIPRTWIHPWGGVGVRTSYGLRGDFEVTATYEILRADTPPRGYGVGVAMRLRKSDANPGLATLCRMVRANGEPIVLWDHTVEAPGEKPKVKERPSPCDATVGRLRLKRTGTTLHYLWAEGTAGDDFHEVQQIEFGAEEVKHVILAGVTGRQPCDLDARFLDFRIHGDSRASDAPATAPETVGGKGWLAAAVLVVLALAGFSAVLGWLYTRQRSTGSPRG